MGYIFNQSDQNDAVRYLDRTISLLREGRLKIDEASQKLLYASNRMGSGAYADHCNTLYYWLNNIVSELNTIEDRIFFLKAEYSYKRR